MNTYAHLWYFAELFLQWEMFQTKVAEKNQTLNLQLLIPQKRETYEIRWKNIVQPDRSHITVQVQKRWDLRAG